MGAYDNPTIIKDLYGMQGWSNFAKSVSDGVASVTNALIKSREKQADLVKKTDELYTKSYIEAEQEQTEKANENFSAMRLAEQPPTLVDQAKKLNEYQMYGGVHMVNGVEKDFGIGSIKASAQAATNLTLDPEVRKQYLKIANDQKESLKNFAKEAALPLTDEDSYAKVVSGTNGFYFAGSTEEERYTNYLVGGAIYNKALGKNIKPTKTYSKEIINGKIQSILSVDIEMPVDSNQASLFTDRKKYPIDEKNQTIKVKWQRNLSDDSWDGNFANETSLKELDYNTLGEEMNVIKNGKLNSAYQHQMQGTSDRGKDFSQKEVLTFVNVDGAMANMNTIVQERAKTMAQMYITGNAQDQEDVAFALKKMGYTGINYQKQVAEGNMTVDQAVDLFDDYILNDMKTHFKLGMERDENGRFVNQRVNGLELQKRVITKKQIEELADANVDVSNIKAGTEQYFYIDQSSLAKEKRGGGSSSSGGGSTSKEERQIAGWKKAIKNKNYKVFEGTGKKIPGENKAYLQYIDGSFYRVDEDGTKSGGALTDAEASSIL